MECKESEWADQIRAGSEEAFRKVFHAYYSELCGFAADYLDSVDRARDVVQEVFLRIWRRREKLDIRVSLKSYLYQAVRNRALNHIRRSETEDEFQDHVRHTSNESDQRTAIDTFHMKELSEDVNEAIADLPDRRRMAFLLHRRHGFTYKEIAQIMEISPKTVENQIGRALKSLRSQLEDRFTRELD
ncbi:MAG: RNA polymerase sigma-70 factor [Bacteroidetes bacterium QH_9_64_21]|nr:MAG: RNA polymerase sigma-70 factor [Bacteroidetes bacterium QH_9_64_21]